MGEEKSWKLDKTLKIDDDQLKTPEHDKICLWVNKHHGEFIRQKDKIGRFYPEGYDLIWEKPIINRGFVIGIPDFTIKNNMGCYGEERVLGFIEVKPKIKSLGETLRQLQLYQNYRDFAKIIIVTKSLEYKEIFEQQGFYFVGVTDEMLNDGK